MKFAQTMNILTCSVYSDCVWFFFFSQLQLLLILKYYFCTWKCM